MTKVKLTFIFIFFAIAVPVGILLARSFSQLQTGAQHAYQEHAYLVLEMLNQRIHSDLAIEEKRSYTDYRFIRTVPVLGGEEVTISPLADMPVNSQYAGIVGYFQLFSDGSVQTPVLPDGFLENIVLEDRAERERIRRELKKIIRELGIKVVPLPETSLPDSNSSLLDKIYEQDLSFDARQLSGGFEPRIEESSQKETFVFDVESARIRRISDDHGEKGERSREVMVVKIEPFQAVFNHEYLVFFRYVLRDNERFIQGFIVRLREYLEAIAQKENIFEPQAQDLLLEFVSGGNTLIAFGKPDKKFRRIFEAPLQSPLSEMSLAVLLSPIGRAPGQNLVIILGVVMFLVLGGGLLALYRLMEGQLDIARKRQNFISAVSHELKTPLTAIRMYAEMLQHTWVASEEKRKKYYDLIVSETERLSRLIQNVLSISKLDRNSWHVQLRSDNPKNVLNAFVAGYTKNIESNGFDLTVTCDDCDFCIMMDKDAVMQILMNLVDNSLKFSQKAEYKMIELKLSVAPNDVYLAVRDYGPGIPSSEMNKVFEEFYRIEDEMTRSTKGTGIGLSMVKKLCALTNMRIEMENALPGLRTKIHFDLSTKTPGQAAPKKAS